MKLTGPLEEAFNEQIKNEYFSAQLYRQMAAWADERGLTGIAYWFKKQADEETTHGDRFVEFLTECSNKVQILPLEGPKSDFESVLDVFQYARGHESFVTKAIHSLYFMAQEERCLACVPFLQDFIAEQVEEEDMFQTIVDRLSIAGNNNAALLQIDKELGTRD